MQLKRFRDPELHGALAKVTREFGPDALLVETRRTPAGYEILAAPHEEKRALEKAHALARTRRASGDAATAPAGSARNGPALGWTRGFEAFARTATEDGWSARVLRAVEKALVGTRVRLDRPGDPAVAGLARKVLSALIRTRSVEDPDSRVVAFVGPTGVGKTTTIAKLAARAIRDRGEQVAIVTLDTYRIAAVEQLRAFADMLAAPFEVAFTPGDLHRAVRRFLDPTQPGGPVDRVLIDTSGRSPRDTTAIRDLGEILRACGAETALCLPAHARARDTRKVLQSWSQVTRPTTTIVTKSDETDAWGEVLSTLVEEGLALSHVTDGQRVPEDIEPFDADDVARGVFPEAAPSTPPHPPERSPRVLAARRG